MSTRILRRVRAALGLAVAGIAAAMAVSATPATAANPSPLVVGGTPASTADYPYIMQIGGGIVPWCGGTLVSPTKVVTAAHCVWGTQPDQVTVVGGRDERQGTSGTERQASEFWIHPEYDGDTNVADIAVITLAEEMPYEPLPYAAPDDTHLYTPGNMARVLGWGRTSEGGPLATELMTAEVPIVSDAECAENYSDFSVQFDPVSMVCAGYPEGGVDTCDRDSGGPLVVDGVLAGIVSWGNGCARPGYPGVYVRMTTYSDEVTAQINS